MKEIQKKLLQIQSELKSPKGQKNSFGNYKYRSCEDILEAVKPLLKKAECILTISDEIIMIGSRFYVKAEVLIADEEEGITVSAYAREAENKKGMDESQITGAASSYARKYALNGLFCIDDTKDADTKDNSDSDKKEEKKESPGVKLNCVDCGKEITKTIKEYSIRHFNKVICMGCQKKKKSD